jgi:hypothetical protein
MKKLFELYKETMLSPSGVLDKAISCAAPATITAAWAKKHFSESIDRIGKEAYGIFLAEQQKAGQRAIELYFDKRVPAKASRQGILKVVANNFHELDRFFLSLAQSRKPRAGGAFEGMIKNLFKKLNYPFAEQQVINGKPDFLMPCREHYDTNPMDCIIFTVKTTLRERWRQIVTEGTRGLGFFLATVDENVSKPQLGEMLRNRIYLVVSQSLKKKVPHYSTAPNVLSFEHFFRDHLDPAVKRWGKVKTLRKK